MDKSLKPVPGLSRSPAHEPVASYCGKAAPGGWDVRAPSLLHRQVPQLTGGRGATQFCLIGQLEGWWSAVWEKAHGARCQLARGGAFLRNGHEGQGKSLLGQEVGGSGMGRRGMGGVRPLLHPSLPGRKSGQRLMISHRSRARE